MQVVERWILARLRHRRFFSLAELNAAIAELLRRAEPPTVQEAARLPAQRLRGAGRAGAAAAAGHAHADRALQARPRQHRLPRRVRRPLLQRAAPAGAAPRSSCASRPPRWRPRRRASAWPSTPAAPSRAAATPRWPNTCRRRTARTCEWTPAKLIAWGERIGVATAAVVRWQMEHRPHPEQGYRACLGLLRLAREFTPTPAGGRLHPGAWRSARPTCRSVTSILACGLDRQPLTPDAPPRPACRCTTTCAAPTTTTDPQAPPPSPPTKENDPCSTNTP